jgi:2-polyprenyl-6-hydroxyphenyl methylase/3-demethylubiquinone-9 3-methyltransferase
VLAPNAPSPAPDALPPVLWGSEGHVRELFGDRVESLEMRRAEYTEQAESPREYYELFRKTFGPVVAIYASLADQPKRTAELDQVFLDFVTRANRGTRGGPARYSYEYLLVIARKGSR